MEKKRYHWSLFLFLTTAFLILYLLQLLLVPKYMETSQEGALTGEYYANAGNHDVIFIGDCEVYENISPITLWEEFGIPSYIRGSPQQTIWQSYYLMEETLRYEKPKVIVFNVLSMKYDTPESTGAASRREAYNRMTLDTMRWSSAKWNAILASMTEEEWQKEGMLTYIFPILRYHDRWSELHPEDFTYWFHRKEISHSGYLMQTGIKPHEPFLPEPPLENSEFGQNSWYYLEKMATLCHSQNVTLVLLKAPSLSPVWHPEWENQIQEFASDQNLLYINALSHLEQIGIDWQKDTYDGGLHLNVQGAEKFSLWLGSILSDTCSLPSRQTEEPLSSLWEEKVNRYHTKKRSA